MNDLSAFTPELWSRRIQAILRKTLVSMEIANSEERPNLIYGDKTHRPYISIGDPVTYVKNTGFSANIDVNTTDEYLEVDQAKGLPMYFDKIDKIQNKYSASNTAVDEAAYKIKKQIDGSFFGEYDNATNDFDDGDIGGTAGNAIAVDTTKIFKLISKAKSKLRNAGVQENKPLVGVFDPDTIAELEIALSGGTTGYQKQDSALGAGVQPYNNGALGKMLGLNMWESNNLPFTAKWTPADNPTDGDTITINGEVATFKATPVSGNSHIDIGANLAATLDNLVAFINGTGTQSATTYYRSSTAATKLFGITATDGATYITIEGLGTGKIAVAASESADVWSAQTVHCHVGQTKAIDLVIQKGVDIDTIVNPINPATGNQMLGVTYIPFALYGIKTYKEGADRFLDVLVDAS